MNLNEFLIAYKAAGMQKLLVSELLTGFFRCLKIIYKFFNVNLWLGKQNIQTFQLWIFIYYKQDLLLISAIKNIRINGSRVE